MGFTNRSNLPLPMAVFLAADGYNHDEEVISVTKFIKPLRELILSERVSTGNTIAQDADVLDMFKSRLGTAVHERIEHVWLDKSLREAAMLSLGYPQKTIDKLVVNPDVVQKGQIPLYAEKTGYKEFMGYMFRGTADVIFNGRLGDYKKTSTYSFNDKEKDKKYGLQGSLYKWIMPDLITDTTMDIYEMYEDWTRMKAFIDPTYPPENVVTKIIPLMDITETERFVKNKIMLINKFYDADEADIPECSDEELWRKPPVHKYYKNPEKKSRSTANFENYDDAVRRKHADNNVGVVETIPSKVVACRFCPAMPACGQAKRYAHSGELDLK